MTSTRTFPLPSAVADDPELVPMGRLGSVSAILRLGGVADAPLDAQRRFVATLATNPAMAPILDPLRPDLELAHLL